MRQTDGPVGVFDSGVGGLSVLKELRQQLPGESFLYYADSAHTPYGPRSAEEVLTFSREITEFLLSHGAKCIVLACNTATASAIHTLRLEFPIPFVGMEPALKTAAVASRSGTIGVLATRGTLLGDHFQKTRTTWASGTTVLTAEGDRLVTLAEEGILSGPEVRASLKSLLLPMKQAGMDQLVLGCTHYPFFRPEMEILLGDGVTIHDPAPAVARQTGRILAKHRLESTRLDSGSTRFFTNGSPDPLFKLIALIGIQNPEVEYLSLTPPTQKGDKS